MMGTPVDEFLQAFDDTDIPTDVSLRYEVIECFSRNAFRETYLVRDRETSAYHVAQCHWSYDPAVSSIHTAVLEKLHHPAIPAYVSDVHLEGSHWIVREYAEGERLDRWIKSHPLDDERFVSIASQLCDVLAYLHGQQPPVIHRDIKPENIIVDSEGKLALIDFHIARTYQADAANDTVALGTRQYAAPEQFGFSQTDPRSDIYALGVLLHWLLTGSADLHLTHTSPMVKRFGAVVAKCTAFDPQQRFQSVQQVKAALTPRTTPRTILLITSIVLFLILGMIGLRQAGWMIGSQGQRIQFKEPLIEEAVRLVLKKGKQDVITSEDLATVRELWIFGDRAAADETGYRDLVDQFASQGGSMSRGELDSLADLTMLPNLKRISIDYQNITDLAPLAGLVTLQHVDLNHNPVVDVTPLSSLPYLTNLSLFGTRVLDLTPLADCEQLVVVDVGATPIDSVEAFAGLESVTTLVIRKGQLTSLEGIGQILPNLEYLYLGETPVANLAPLLSLPFLKLVEVSEDTHLAAADRYDNLPFQLIAD
ncbi:MAG: protein kinase [Anaerolineae bacterium]|nr:protein kinase [Anaerolineae bacterium]